MYRYNVARDPVTTMPAKAVPPYGRRAGLVPRRPEDFGAGGAFPEVHVAQYPLSMGLSEAAPGGSSDVLAVTVDARGRVAFDAAVVRQGENAAKIVYSSHADLVPRITPAPDHQDTADEGEAEATTVRTRAALQEIIDARVSAVHVRPQRSRRDDPALVKYRPARQLAAFNSGAEERIVRVEHAQEDPVLPPKHRRRRVPCPAAGSSPPVTVMHSPPRPVSREDMSDWKIAPSISDWKNPGGYCIPLDKRVAADGRRMQDVQVSDGFASLSEALCVAEQKAREAIDTRAEVVKALKTKADEQRGRELREIANRARAAMASDAAAAPPADAEQRIQRDMVREERRRQRECERRREAASAGKKSRIPRDRDRDVSERIALGMASTGGAGAGAGELAYDERLFNQDAGMDSGFAADDRYSVYSGRLFAVQPALSMLYRPKMHGDSDTYGDEHVEKITRTGRFKPDKVFSDALERPALVGKRDRPVEFDMRECREADDPFVELDQYMAKVKEGKKY